MPKIKRIVFVATDAELSKASYRNRLKVAVYNVGTGQREWPTKIQDMFLHADMNGIDIRFPDGRKFPIPLVDDVWDNNERYIRTFFASKQCVHPAKDRLIDLYFRVMMPEIQKHFNR